ncbi:MAG TPA: hypothetical protein VLO11_11890, partial [Luteolibacter sp.]|nr:hypothetical protein [Luteolibacter sp.]
HCEQAGIVGSLGPAFSLIEGNHIHDIHIRRLFSGAEMAAIKFHAPIDTVIRDNHIHRACRGIWLDWMTQGTRVTRNLVHDIAPWEDVFVEVNHGPFLIDHNLFLSPFSLADWSEGGTYTHNLFAGKVVARPEPRRETPWLEEHGTRIAGLASTKGGDNRYYNNLFVAPAGLAGYNESVTPNTMKGNLFLHGARPSRHEASPVVLADFDPAIRLRAENGTWFLDLNVGWGGTASGPLVTSDLLGETAVSGMAFVKPDGSPYRLDRDFHGGSHAGNNPSPGPFAGIGDGTHSIKVWPPARP